MPHKHPGDIAVNSNESGFVDMNCHDNKCFPTSSNDVVPPPTPYHMYKVRLRATRVPTISNKFSNHHGQKGTVGALRKHEDMPFPRDGIAPDVVINPHAIPGHITVGQRRIKS